MIFTFVPAEGNRHPDEGVAFSVTKEAGKEDVAAFAGNGFTRRRAVLQHSGGYQSGQMGQTVNLLSFDFGGSNPSPPTRSAGPSPPPPRKDGSGALRRNENCGSSSVGRALAFQAKGRGFEPRLPLDAATTVARFRKRTGCRTGADDDLKDIEGQLFLK